MTEKAATAPITPVFAPTGWKTLALDHITFEMPTISESLDAVRGYKSRRERVPGAG